MTPDKIGLIGLMIQTPITKRNDYDFKFKAFGFMYSHYPHGILLLRSRHRQLILIIVPPRQKRTQVGRMCPAIIQDIILKSLYIYPFTFVSPLIWKIRNNPLAHLEQRLFANTLDKGEKIIIEMPPDVLSIFEIRQNNRIIKCLEFSAIIFIDSQQSVQFDRRILNISQNSYQQIDYRRVSYQQRLTRYNIVTITPIGILGIQTQQQIDKHGPFSGSSRQKRYVAGGVPPIL